MENKAYLGLGSNKGDSLKNLEAAVSELKLMPYTKIESCSFVYETKPYGEVNQQNFYNAACLLKTGLSIDELFIWIKEVERRLGRTKTERWGPREIDIDILLYNDLIYSNESLNIPHKEMLKRDFVIIPLLDVDSELVHPVTKTRLSEIVFEEKYIINRLETNLLTTSGE